MKYLLCFLLVGCYELSEESTKYDYMFTLPNGTWICDKNHYNTAYTDCEHVLSGKKSDRIVVGEDVTIINVKEGTK